MEKDRLVSLQEVLKWDRKQARRNYSSYINPGLASLMSLLNFDKRFVRAQGVEVWDEDGNCYLDFLGGYGALNLGHNPDAVWQAIKEVQGVPNLLQASISPLVSALGKNLAAIAPGELKHSFFCNSGTEAVEGALKTARKATSRQDIVYCEGGFHGKSMGALSVTGRSKYQDPFAPLVPGCRAVPYGDLEALERELQTEKVCAFIVEAIQGEGGVIVPPPGYLKGAEQLCHRYGTLLIVDEVQTGLGRTGLMFACEHEEVRPDILCLAKSLGGGVVPIGVFMTTEEIWDKAYGGIENCLLHTSTFGGNALACAAGIASLQEIVNGGLAERARELGGYMLKQLQLMQGCYPLIKEVRGRGLLIGIEFADAGGSAINKITGGIINRLGKEYLASLVAGELNNNYKIITAYTLNNPNVIRLEPPLIVSRQQVDYLLESLEDIFRRHKNAFSLAMGSSRTVARSILKR